MGAILSAPAIAREGIPPASCPAIAGKGDHPAQQGGGRGAGRNVISMMQGRVLTMSSMIHFVLLVNQFCRYLLSCNGNEAPSPAPPPPRFARFASSSGPPPPLSRWRMVRALSFPRRVRVRVLPTKSTNLLPPKKQGEAERRKGAPIIRALRSTAAR